MHLEALAATQLGLFTLAQAASCGLSASALGRRVAEGSIDRLHKGVFGFAGGAPHPHAATLAAVLRAGSGAFAAGRSAAFVHGVLAHPPPLVELTSPRQVRVCGAVVMRTALPVNEQRLVGAVPAACLERAIVQAAGSMGDDALHQLVADAVRMGRTIPTRVLATLDRTPPRVARGAPTLRMILADGLSYSPPERELMRLLRAAGITGFVPNLPFTGPSGHRWIIDAARPDIRLAVEVDSASWHGGPARHQADVDKFNDIQDAGWYLIRVTPAELRDHPERVLARIRKAIAQLSA